MRRGGGEEEEEEEEEEKGVKKRKYTYMYVWVGGMTICRVPHICTLYKLKRSNGSTSLHTTKQSNYNFSARVSSYINTSIRHMHTCADMYMYILVHAHGSPTIHSS